MPLRQEDWGKILIDYYKQHSDSFYITLDDIIEAAKAYAPEYADRQDVLIQRSFASSLGIYPEQRNLSQIAGALNKVWQYGPDGSDLCVLSVLICTCESHSDEIVNVNNYYVRLREYLRTFLGYDRPVAVGNIRTITSFFIGLDINGLIDKVNRTCRANDIPLAFELIAANDRRRYAQTILNIYMINGTVRERFKYIFGQSGFIPTYCPTDGEFLAAFNAHHNEIHIPDDKAEQMRENLDMLFGAIHKAFEAWDGSTDYTFKTKRNDQTIKTTATGKSVESIVLSLVPSRADRTLKLQAYVEAKAESESSLRYYQTDAYGDFTAQIRKNGKSWSPLQNNRFEDGRLAADWLRQEEQVVLKDSENGCKAVFKPRDFYLFHNVVGVWEECLTPEVGREYLLLVRKDKKDEVFASMGDSEMDDDFNRTSPVENYELLKIRRLDQVPETYGRNRRKPQPSAVIENFYFGPDREPQTVVLNDKKFIVKLENWESMPTDVRITSTDNTRSHTLSLNDNGQWCLDFSKIESESYDRNQSWKLFVDSRNALSFDFRFGEFHCPGEFMGMALTIDGEIDRNGTVFGLDLLEEQLRDYRISYRTEDSIKNNNTPLPPSQSCMEDSPADRVLYALTSLSHDFFTQKDAEDAARSMAPDILNCHKKFQYILNDWFALGYLNSGVDGSRRKFVANRPTLILLAPDYKIEVENYTANHVIQKTTRKYILPSHFSALLTGGRDPKLIEDLYNLAISRDDFTLECSRESDTLPCTVRIHTKKIDYPKQIDVFAEIATQLGLQYSPCIYSSALFAGLPTIAQYMEAARSRVASYEGGFLTFDIPSIASDLESGKMRNSDGYKTEERNENPGFRIYTRHGSKVGVIADAGGSAYHVGIHWGRWIQALNENVSLARVEGNELLVPGVTPLPNIYQRALCLISGQLPTFDCQTRINHYRLAVNPTTPATYVTGNGILDRLGARQNNNQN